MGQAKIRGTFEQRQASATKKFKVPPMSNALLAARTEHVLSTFGLGKLYTPARSQQIEQELQAAQAEMQDKFKHMFATNTENLLEEEQTHQPATLTYPTDESGREVHDVN